MDSAKQAHTENVGKSSLLSFIAVEKQAGSGQCD